MTDSEAAYLAGLFDGEGCVVARIFRLRSLRSGLQIAMKHRETIERAQQIAGGQVDSSRSLWVWTLNGEAAIPVVERILPFSITKREQLELYLQLPRCTSRHGMTDDVHKRRIGLVQAIRAAKS